MTARNRSILKHFSPEMREELAYRDYLQARADRTGLPIHQPYCGCISTWTSQKRDPGCNYEGPPDGR